MIDKIALSPLELFVTHVVNLDITQQIVPTITAKETTKKALNLINIQDLHHKKILKENTNKQGWSVIGASNQDT